jgi:hypothetical protein
MSRFASLIRRTGEKLDVPQPARARVLLELAADLEDLYGLYRERGLDDSAAVRKVEEKFDVSDDALSQLVKLHRSVFRRWADRFSEQAQTLWERLLLVVIVIFIAVSIGPAFVSSTFFRDASAFIWVVTAIALIAVAFALAKSYQLYIKKDHGVRRLRTGLPSLLMLGCASIFTGWFGFIAGMYHAMSGIAGGVERPDLCIMNWLLGSVATMIASLMVAILTALLWFLLIGKVRRIERAEAALLLEYSS